jgi:hypothetical protein
MMDRMKSVGSQVAAKASATSAFALEKAKKEAVSTPTPHQPNVHCYE